MAVFRRDGQAAAGFRHHVVAHLARKKDRFARHHIVHQLVEADAVAIKGASLQPDVQRVKLRKEGGDVRLFNRREELDVFRNPQLFRLFHQPFLFNALADQDQLQLFPPPFLPGLDAGIQCVGKGVPAGIAYQEPALFMIPGQLLPVRGRRRVGRRLPLLRKNAVGDADKLSRIHPMLRHMLLGAGKEGHHVVAGTVAGVFRPLHHHNKRVVLAHAANRHRAEGPEIVHLINQLRAVFSGDAAGGIDVQRIGGGGDHHIRLPGFQDFRPVAGHPAEEGQHIPDAAKAVPLIPRAADPEIPHPVDILLRPGLVPQLRVHPPQVGKRAGHDGDRIPGLRPPAGQIERAVFHPVPIRAGVMLQIDNIHRGDSPFFCRGTRKAAGGGPKSRPVPSVSGARPA